MKENSIKTHPKGWKVIKPSGDLSNRRNSRLVELWSCRTAPLIKRVFFYRRNRNMEVVEKLCRICRTIFALQWLCRHAVGPNWWNCFGMRSLPISLAAKLQLWILGCWAKGGGAKWPPTKLTDDVIYKQLPGRFMRIVECLQTVGYLSNLALFLYLFRWFFNIPLGLPLCPLHCVILCYSGANSIDHHIITAHLVWHIGSWFWTMLVFHPDSVALFHKLTDMEVSVVLKKRSCKPDGKGMSVCGKVNVKSAKNWNSWEHRDHMPLTSTNVKTCPSRFTTLIAAQCELENKRM